jgi:hypothetical protein
MVRCHRADHLLSSAENVSFGASGRLSRSFFTHQSQITFHKSLALRHCVRPFFLCAPVIFRDYSNCCFFPVFFAFRLRQAHGATSFRGDSVFVFSLRLSVFA